MGGKISKERLDVLLVKRGFFDSRETARRHVMAGLVFVNGEKIDKPGRRVLENSEISLKEPPKYVSRGGYKIESAWKVFRFEVEGKVACDIGASTGGFTDFLLKKGAKKVYAVDVGTGQLHWKLRNDPRVVVMEKVNARHISEKDLGEKVDLVTCDVSFISLEKIIPAISRILKGEGKALLLVKPQFEAGKEYVTKGVVRDPKIHIMVLNRILKSLRNAGFSVNGLTPSMLKGPKGNIEYFVLASSQGEDSEPNVEEVVKKAFDILGGSK